MENTRSKLTIVAAIVLAVALVAILAVGAVSLRMMNKDLSDANSSLGDRISSLQNDIYVLSAEITKLQRSASPISYYNLKLTGANPEQTTASASVAVNLREYSDNTEVSVVVYGEVMKLHQERNGRFSATIDVPLFGKKNGNDAPKFIIEKSGMRRTDVLEEYSFAELWKEILPSLSGKFDYSENPDKNSTTAFVEAHASLVWESPAELENTVTFESIRLSMTDSETGEELRSFEVKTDGKSDGAQEINFDGSFDRYRIYTVTVIAEDSLGYIHELKIFDDCFKLGGNYKPRYTIKNDTETFTVSK